MGDTNLPPEVLRVIEAGEVAWSKHAASAADRLGVWWGDVIEVAHTAESWKRERDETGEALDGWKDAVTGRDLRGRRLYLAGKRVYYRGEPRWYVITIHEAD